jgi:hypothetical protein
VFARQLTKLWHDHGNHQVDALYDTDRTIANGNSLAGSAETVRDLLVERVRQAPAQQFHRAVLDHPGLDPDPELVRLLPFQQHERDPGLAEQVRGDESGRAGPHDAYDRISQAHNGSCWPTRPGPVNGRAGRSR